MPEEERTTYTLAEVQDAMDEIDTEDEAPSAGRWTMIGKISLREKLRFRAKDDNTGEIIEGEVLESDENGTLAQLKGHDEPSHIPANRLEAAKDFVIEHKKEGVVIVSAVSLSAAGLYVWIRNRD